MPAPAIHHVDLAVGDVERSLAFYLAVLGPVGLHEAERYPSYRGTEEVVYLRYGDQYLGLRPADGGKHHYYDVGIEHLAFYVDNREEVDAAYQRCLEIGARIHFPPVVALYVSIVHYELFVFDPDGIRVEVSYAAADESS